MLLQTHSVARMLKRGFLVPHVCANLSSISKDLEEDEESYSDLLLKVVARELAVVRRGTCDASTTPRPPEQSKGTHALVMSLTYSTSLASAARCLKSAESAGSPRTDAA